jgi:hypothetical protein
MFIKNTDGSLKLSQGFDVEIVPDVVALARTVDNSISASTEIVLNPATKFIQVYAIAKDVYLKWGADDVTAANFDEVIPAGQVMNFLVPNGITAVNLIERESSATVIVIEK